MKFLFDLTLLNLKGDPIVDEIGKEQTCGEILANTLASANKGNPVKFYGWALSLTNKQPLYLDKADQKTLLDFVENHEQLTNLGKAQIMAILYTANGE